MNNQTRQLNLIYLNTYQSAQIMAYVTYTMVGHVESETHLSQIMKKEKFI